MMNRDITLLSTADWDNPFWTNKQHVAVELARRGNRVLYINSLGLRRPSVSTQDALRIGRRLAKALAPPRRVREGLWVWSPIVIPLHRYTVVRRINRYILDFGLRFWSWVYSFERDLLWTYNPMTTELLPLRGFSTLVYHCVDEVKAQPGMPSEQIELAEGRLLRSADICFVTAESLLESRRRVNSHTFYLPNVADFSHFARDSVEATQIPGDLATIPRPRIGFVGAISGYKLDFQLIQKVALAHPEWSIVMIGKVGEGDPGTNIGAVDTLQNVHFLGPRSYSVLPAYLKSFDVGILPNLLNKYTTGMFPMKFFEYLAAGLPVVCTDLPALRGYSHVAWLTKNSGEFIAAIERALSGEGADLDARLVAAREQTYERRTESMLKMISDRIERRQVNDDHALDAK